MSVQISTRQVGAVTVIDASGRITLGDGASQLRDKVKELLAEGKQQLLVNMADVTYIDSSGIGELVSAYTSVSGLGGQMRLLKVTNRVKDLLQITKLYTVFDVADDEAAGVASFK